ncbi:MAG: hypothetical protein AAGG50_11115 [Bacteroidota bacterium]
MVPVVAILPRRWAARGQSVEVKPATVRTGLALWACIPGALGGDPGDIALLDATLSGWLPRRVARRLLAYPTSERVDAAIRLLDGDALSRDQDTGGGQGAGSQEQRSDTDWPALLTAYANACGSSVAEALDHPWRHLAVYTHRARAVRATHLVDLALTAQAAQSPEAVHALNDLVAERTAVLFTSSSPKTDAEKQAADRATLNQLSVLLGGNPTA